jgi:hypothetical protein
MNTMNMPGFTAEASFSKTSANCGLSRSQRTIPASLLPTVQMAKLPGEEEPGVYGIKCGVCSSTGWQWCEKTLDGQSLDLPPFKRKCVPGGGGGSGGNGSGGNDKTQECALDFWKCTVGCQFIPWPGSWVCEAKCIADRIDCLNPF